MQYDLIFGLLIVNVHVEDFFSKTRRAY
jgi:hypothetical protein